MQRCFWILLHAWIVLVSSGCTLDSFVLLESATKTPIDAELTDPSDPGFVNKILTTNFSTEEDYAWSFAPSSAKVLPDSKILVAGWLSESESFDVFIARHNADGTLDTSFNSTGYVITDFDNLSGEDTPALEYQSDGKILLAMSVNSTSLKAGVVRYNTNGTYDSTFGTNGRALFDFGSNQTLYVSDVALQADGKILIAGTDEGLSTRSFFVARLNTNGTLDTTFNSVGYSIQAFAGATTTLNSVRVQADGKIVLFGSTFASGDFAFGLMRFNTDGSLDTGFGTSGKSVILPAPYGNLMTGSFLIESSGKFLLAGTASDVTSRQLYLVKLNSDGSKDTSFNGTGAVYNTATGNEEYVTDLILQADGKIVASAQEQFTSYLRIHRFNADGTPDTSFFSTGMFLGSSLSTRGTSTSSSSFPQIFSVSNTQVLSLARSPHARGSYKGYLLDATNSSTTSVLEGISYVVKTSSSDRATAVGSMADGRFVVAGIFSNQTESRLALARYFANGKRDLSFGDQGKALSSGFSEEISIAGIHLDSSGNIILAGTLQDDEKNVYIFKFNSDGSVDTSFGNQGLVTFDSGTNENDEIFKMEVQSDGKILLAGEVDKGLTERSFLVRFNANGSLDSGFATAGVWIQDVSSGEEDSLKALKILPDGKIIAVGSGYFSATLESFLIRFNINGSLDTSFGTSGILRHTSPAGLIPRAMAVQSDGKIVVLGRNDAVTEILIARYSPDGSLDTSFNSVGYSSSTAKDEIGVDLKILSSGKILVAGSNYASNESLAYMVFNVDGTIDVSRSADGLVTIPFPGYTYSQGVALALTSTGTALLVGTAEANDDVGEDFAVFHFEP